MDNFLLQAVTNELADLASGAHLGKVFQLGLTDLRMDLRLRDGRWLALSTDPARLALYLTAGDWKRAETEARQDTAFPALCKKYLSGARVTAIEKLGYDRVVTFDLQAHNEDGTTTARQLVVTLIGRAANVMIVEAGKIIASLRERRSESDAYQEPALPTDKLDPFQVSAEQLERLIAASNGNVAEAAHIHLLGFTNLYANELAHRHAGVSAGADKFTALPSLLADLFEHPPQATVYSTQPFAELLHHCGDERLPAVLSPIVLRHLSHQHAETFGAVNAAAGAFYGLLTARRQFTALQQQCQSHLAARLKKQRQLLANLTREQAAFSRGTLNQRYGELLLANAHQALKDEDTFLVTDYYDEAQTTIAIPAVQCGTVQEAAERYFKLARKARNGSESLSKRLPQLHEEIAHLETWLQQLPQQTQWDDLTNFARHIGVKLKLKAPTTATPPKAAKKPDAKISGVRRYRSTDGFEMLVGRSNTDNDRLTLRVAKSHDLWFHAADYPGSHVILRNPARKPVPPQAIVEAAQLAAKFSQARTEARIGVNYCEKKFVTKPKGFAPGQVRLSSFKTVLVEPKEAGERLLD